MNGIYIKFNVLYRNGVSAVQGLLMYTSDGSSIGTRINKEVVHHSGVSV